MAAGETAIIAAALAPRPTSSASRRASRGAALFLVVVEEAEHVAALALPAADAERPTAQHIGAVAALVAATRTVRPQIDVARRDLPARRRMVVIGDAER